MIDVSLHIIFNIHNNQPQPTPPPPETYQFTTSTHAPPIY